jgi:heme-degrading monooxygenase HmoA
MRVIIDPSCRNTGVTVSEANYMRPVARSRETPPSAAYIDGVIVRVLAASVSEQNSGEFNNLLRKQLDELRDQPGLVYAKLARRLSADGAEEVMLFEEWRTPDDLWAWTGGRLNEPRLLPGTEQLIDRLTISHYEALDMDMDEDVGAPAVALPDDVSVRGT